MRRNYLILAAVFSIGLIFGVAQSNAQTVSPAVGNINLSLQPKNQPKKMISAGKLFLHVPVNEKQPVLLGGMLRVVPSHGIISFWHVSSSAVSDKEEAGGAVLRITLNIDSNGINKAIQKKIKLRKGETKEFSLSLKGVGYEITAFYQ